MVGTSFVLCSWQSPQQAVTANSRRPRFALRNEAENWNFIRVTTCIGIWKVLLCMHCSRKEGKLRSFSSVAPRLMKGLQTVQCSPWEESFLWHHSAQSQGHFRAIHFTPLRLYFQHEEELRVHLHTISAEIWKLPQNLTYSNVSTKRTELNCWKSWNIFLINIRYNRMGVIHES